MHTPGFELADGVRQEHFFQDKRAVAGQTQGERDRFFAHQQLFALHHAVHGERACVGAMQFLVPVVYPLQRFHDLEPGAVGQGALSNKKNSGGTMRSHWLSRIKSPTPP
jgi:hypothetical protein